MIKSLKIKNFTKNFFTKLTKFNKESLVLLKKKYKIKFNYLCI